MLKENGNPTAKFDVDTLTAFRVVVEATAENVPVNGGIIGGINAEEKKNDGVNAGDDTVNVVENVVEKRLSEREIKIYNLLKSNPYLTASDLQKELQISHRTVQRDLFKMQNKEILRREGGDKGGKWVILK